MGYIYLLTNKINNKKYVGQTIRDDINKRWNQHKYNKTNDTYISRALNKYGIDNFKFQIICICFNEDCNKFEEEYIKKFNTISPKGYNLSNGGKNKSTHPDTKKLISEKLKQRWKVTKHPSIGIKYSDEYKEKMSKSVKKSLNELRLKGITQNINSLENLKIASEKRKRKVAQYNMVGELLLKFNSISEAVLKTNINNRRISDVCNNKAKTAGGFIWKFI